MCAPAAICTRRTFYSVPKPRSSIDVTRCRTVVSPPLRGGKRTKTKNTYTYAHVNKYASSLLRFPKPPAPTHPPADPPNPPDLRSAEGGGRYTVHAVSGGWGPRRTCFFLLRAYRFLSFGFRFRNEISDVSGTKKKQKNASQRKSHEFLFFYFF